jgi:methylthioribose-1-phosphate isomerase
VPFYAVMPTSTIDRNTPSGDDIPIEERGPDEIRSPHGLDLMPKDYPVLNPAFDVTPHRYVTGIVTEHGVAYPPFDVSLRKAVEGRVL